MIIISTISLSYSLFLSLDYSFDNALITIAFHQEELKLQKIFRLSVLKYIQEIIL